MREASIVLVSREMQKPSDITNDQKCWGKTSPSIHWDTPECTAEVFGLLPEEIIIFKSHQIMHPKDRPLKKALQPNEINRSLNRSVIVKQLFIQLGCLFTNSEMLQKFLTCLVRSSKKSTGFSEF